MKTYLVSIMGKKGIFKKEIKATTKKVDVGYLCFYKSNNKPGERAFIIIKEWILVEEVDV